MNIYVDGSGTNGISCSYAVVDENGNILKHEIFTGDEGGATNNEMEYRALIEALGLAEDGDLIFSDSQLVVNQVSGKWKVKEWRLMPLMQEAAKILRSKSVKIEWIKRSANIAGWYLERY